MFRKRDDLKDFMFSFVLYPGMLIAALLVGVKIADVLSGWQSFIFAAFMFTIVYVLHKAEEDI